MKTKKGEMNYEAPRLMSLGNLEAGFGGCISGSVATGACKNGASVSNGVGQCQNGSGATNNCSFGSAV